MPARSERAARVLQRLADDAEGAGAPGAAGSPSWLTGGASELGGVRSVRRPLLIGLGVLAAVALAAALLLDRRPPPIEEQLPLAGESSTTSTTVAPAAEGGAPAVAGEDTPGEVFVHVAGAVSSPGVVELPAGSRVVDAVRAAGGLRPDADPDRVNLAAQLADGQRVIIPVVGQEAPAEVLPSGPAPPGSPGTSGADGAGGPEAAGAPIDLNTASAEQLETLPGIGPATASAIISHREREGPFTNVDALIEVRGIGEAKLEAVRELVTVGGGA